MEPVLKKASWQTDDEHAQAVQWVSERPENVRRTILEYLNPSHKCYRIDGHPGHYGVCSIDQPEDDPRGPCTVTLVHLEDSTLPEGVGVYGIVPRQLHACGCKDFAD